MKKSNYVIIAMFVVLIVIGTIWDYNVTDILSGNAQPISRFFEIFGEGPTALSMACGFSYFVVTRNKDVMWKNIVQGLVIGLMALAASWQFISQILAYIFKGSDGNSHGTIPGNLFFLIPVLTVVIFGLIIFLISRVNKETLKQYKAVAIMGIIYPFAVFALTSLIKTVWGRPRYWYVNAGNAEFQPWYSINGPVTANERMSFVSGHTANAFTMLMVSLLPLDKQSSKAKTLLWFAMSWGLLTALSRLLMGQHYLTDVVFGGLLSVSLFFLFKKLLKIK